MAFTQSSFASVGANSTDAPAVYSYETNDSLAVVGGALYFNDKIFQLELNDIILVNASDGFAIFQSDGAGGASNSLGAGSQVIPTSSAILTSNLAALSGVRTYGYSAVNDGGAATWAATGNTVGGSAGTFNAATGLIYDSVGTEFEYAEPIINVIAFGAVPDLSTDNDAVITNCIAYAKSRATVGGVIYFPAIDSGFITGEVAADSLENIVFKGDGTRLQVKNAGTDNYIFNLTNSTEVTFEGLLFTGNSDNNAVYANANRKAGLGIFTSSFVKIQDCVFEKFTSFGVFAQNLTGGTQTEGLTITNNIFRDAPYDSGTVFQCGILLSDDAEYSIISNNKFYGIPSAIRLDDGANSTIEGNMILSCNGGYDTQAACIYQEANSNSGKLIIKNNHINHNETSMITMWLKGDNAKPQNAPIIEGNEFLENGTATHSFQLILNDQPNARIKNNVFRPNATATGEPCIQLTDCSEAYVEGNYFDGGDYAIKINGETIYIGKNEYDSQVTGKITGTGGFRVTHGRTYTFGITSAGGKDSTLWDDTGFNVSSGATGEYTITHSIGTTNYGVVITQDGDTTPPDSNIAVVRGTADFKIYIDNDAGSGVAAAFTATVTIGRGDPFGL